MTARTPRLAVNPIAYWLVDGRVDKSRAVLEEAFGHFRTLGFTAVKADVPVGMSTGDYLDWLTSFGLAPSVSLFNSTFDDRPDARPLLDMALELDKAKAFAAQQAALGLDRAMVSSFAIPARLAAPGVGADFSPDRLSCCIDNLGRVCEAMHDEGIHALLHNHIGGVFETAEEIDAALAGVPAGLLGFGPDTGHLVWAGADPAAMIARHADRMGAVHLKDAFSDLLDPSTRVGMSYVDVQSTMRLWAEPGYGVVDFGAVLAAFPAGYDGDYMIEVDVPSVADRFDSMRRCREWAQRALPTLR